MTQGNPFGSKGGRWMPASKLRALARAGRSYDQIAEANERAENWKPSRSAVKRKLEAIGVPPRNASHTDLIPWNVRVEHNHHLFRHMLEAESRRRQNDGKAQSETDRKLIARLNDLLFGRGTPLVIDYDQERGFSLVLAEEGDELIRKPESQAVLRKEIRAALRDEVNHDYDPDTARRLIDAIEGQALPEPNGDAGHRERA